MKTKILNRCSYCGHWIDDWYHRNICVEGSSQNTKRSVEAKEENKNAQQQNESNSK